MAQRRGVRRIAPLFECGAGRSQLLPTAPGAVNQDDVFGFGHETKDDSRGARLVEGMTAVAGSRD